MKKCIGYVRVSTESQRDSGVSLAAQEEKIKSWAVLNDAELIGIETDAGISGKRYDNRPGFQKALEMACREEATLVVYSLSRMSRSTRDTIEIAEKIQKSNAHLVSLSEDLNTDSPSGRLVFKMFSVLFEFETDLLASRVKSALSYKKAKGEKTGGYVPFGYTLDVDGIHLLENRKEQETIRLARSLRESGMSLERICRELESRKILTKRGSDRWYPQSIKRLLAA